MPDAENGETGQQNIGIRDDCLAQCVPLQLIVWLGRIHMFSFGETR